jgi:hypothetical protein
MFQVTVPLGYYNKCPVSVSLIARYGSDRFLLDTVQTMYKTLQEQAETYVNSKSSNKDSRENSAELAKEKVDYAFLMCLTCQNCNMSSDRFWIEFDCTWHVDLDHLFVDFNACFKSISICTSEVDWGSKVRTEPWI